MNHSQIELNSTHIYSFSLHDKLTLKPKSYRMINLHEADNKSIPAKQRCLEKDKTSKISHQHLCSSCFKW